MRTAALLGVLCAAVPLSSSAESAAALSAAWEKASLLRAAQEPPAAFPRSGLALRQTGTRTSADPETGTPVVTKLYLMTIGDTQAQDVRAFQRFMAGYGRFALNAAAYFPNGDGTWKAMNFRLPGETSEERERFLRHITRPDVREVIEDPFRVESFGEPEDFVYIRARIPAKGLPFPLNGVSAEARAPLYAVFQYNEGGAMKLLLDEPNDEEPNARAIYERLGRELELAASGATRLLLASRKEREVCTLRRIEKDECVYSCSPSGREHRRPVEVAPAWDDRPVVACPQSVIPF